MKRKEIKNILSLLEKDGIIIPSKIIDNEIILELETAILTPYSLGKFLNKLINQIDEFFKKDEIKNLQNMINTFRNQYANLLKNEEDEKIIYFLVSKNSLNFRYKYIFEIMGPSIFIFETLDELDKIKNKSTHIYYFVFLHLYVNLYEIILHQLDRHLYEIIINNSEWKNLNKKFLEKIKREEYNDHATAGEIADVLEKLGLKTEKSILGNNQECRIFRNKISHANAFCDSKNNKIIIGKNQYDFEEFKKLFIRLFYFVVNWMKKSIDICVSKDSNEPLEEKIKTFLIAYLKNIAQLCKKIERSGELKKQYYNTILTFKKEHD